MKSLLTNKKTNGLVYSLFTLTMGAFTYWGLTMTDAASSSLLGFNFGPKQVALAGLGIGLIWLIARLCLGSIFEYREMPRAIIIPFAFIVVIGMLVVWDIRRPDDFSRVPVGPAILGAGAILPMLLYGALGEIVNRVKR